jgi:hypothetical protein
VTHFANAFDDVLVRCFPVVDEFKEFERKFLVIFLCVKIRNDGGNDFVLVGHKNHQQWQWKIGKVPQESQEFDNLLVGDHSSALLRFGIDLAGTNKRKVISNQFFANKKEKNIAENYRKKETNSSKLFLLAWKMIFFVFNIFTLHKPIMNFSTWENWFFLLSHP